jgi:peptide/nickel transport system substrate-binding protein
MNIMSECIALIHNSQVIIEQVGEAFKRIYPQADVINIMDESLLRDIKTKGEIDHEFKPIPELAESWEASPDAKIWTFRLRKGVEFHNGKSLTAEDVLYSVNLHRGEKSKSAVKSLLAQIEDVRSDDKDTVVFQLTGGNADFPFIMSDYHVAIVPDGTEGDEFDKGIGTGPCELVKYEAGVTTHTKRNPNYWKENRAFFDEVETIGIGDTNTRITAIKSGKVDHINRCDLKLAKLLERAKGVNVLKTPGTYHYSIPMLMDIKPFDNNDVRLALKYAIDREQILKTVFGGYGNVGNDHPIAKIQRYAANDLPQRQYDPDKAKYHLKKAGLQNHTFKLYTSDEFGFMDTSVLYKEHAAKAGINIELVRVSTDGYWDDIWRKKPWVMCNWGGRPTPDWMFSTSYAEDASWNDSHWKHPRFNKLLKEARAELDETKRGEMYAEMQRICRDEGGVIVHIFQDHVEAKRTKVGHGPLAGNWQSDGARNAERWWFES